MTKAFLTITSTPPGEAPVWVREKWVGLVLPLAQRSPEAHTFIVSGVLSSPKNFFGWVVGRVMGKFRRESGYAVACIPAVELLSKTSPEAADWWREHTPHFFRTGKYFVFQEGVGHVVSKDAP